MGRHADSSQTVVSIIFLVMNLDRLLACSFFAPFECLFIGLGYRKKHYVLAIVQSSD
jgi:hypothetical protein